MAVGIPIRPEAGAHAAPFNASYPSCWRTTDKTLFVFRRQVYQSLRNVCVTLHQPACSESDESLRVGNEVGSWGRARRHKDVQPSREEGGWLRGHMAPGGVKARQRPGPALANSGGSHDSAYPCLASGLGPRLAGLPGGCVRCCPCQVAHIFPTTLLLQEPISYHTCQGVTDIFLCSQMDLDCHSGQPFGMLAEKVEDRLAQHTRPASPPGSLCL